MAKFRIIFENNELQSCKPTTRFIGDREKEWKMDYSISSKKNQVEFLVDNMIRDGAIKFVKKNFKKYKVLHTAPNRTSNPIS